MRWFTSDLHLGHDNIRRFAGRPFADTHHMNTELIRRINDRVGPDDELWLLGDACLGDLTRTLPILRRIVAPVVLVAGNHDRCHPYHGAKHEAWLDTYRQLAGLADIVTTNTDLVLTDGTNVQISHFPHSAEDNRRDPKVDKFARWRPADDGRWLLHGHVHGIWRQKGRQIDVGIDAWGGHPVSEQELLDQGLTRAVQDLPPLPWTAP